jgi:membrane-bound metal-dependent hydrolase YbcI (DUF457 family)
MPSPLGHAMAGAIVALSSERLMGEVRSRHTSFPAFMLLCVGIAVLPDADLLYLPAHRVMTHSFTAAVFVMIIAASVTRWVTGRIDWGVAAACGAASLSHLLLDWLGQDANAPRGIQALWPFSDAWLISGWDVFRSTERRNIFSAATIRHNLVAGAQEMLLLGPLLLALWATRRRGPAERTI